MFLAAHRLSSVAGEGRAKGVLAGADAANQMLAPCCSIRLQLQPHAYAVLSYVGAWISSDESS